MTRATAPAPPAPRALNASRTTPSTQLRIDPLGAGALLIAVAGLIAVVLLLRPAAVPAPVTASLQVSAQMTDDPALRTRPVLSADTHHPVDRRDTAEMQAPDSWALNGAKSIGADVHRPVDKHEE